MQAVRGVNLSVDRGECFGLLGPNGAGKTTTLEIIEGLLTASSGDVEVLGRRWGVDDQALRERIGISLQETRLPDRLTVREAATLFRSFYPSGISPDAAVAAVSLQEKARAYVDSLSGGQRQRLAVACALVGDPDLLCLDEPTTGLDPQSRRELWEVIRAFKARGRTVLLTTHYMDEAERLCDRVAVIDHGRVIALGTPPELIRTAGGEHVLDVRLAGDLATCWVTAEDLARLPTVAAVRPADDGFSLTAAEPHTALPALLVLLQQKGVTPTGLVTRMATLDDVFLALTGRHLRDGDPSA